MVAGYCLKEKKSVEIKEPKYELNKKGRPVVHGKCASCGGKVYKILKSTEVPAELAAKVKKVGAGSRKSSGSRKSRGSRKSSGSRKAPRRTRSRKSSSRRSRK